MAVGVNDFQFQYDLNSSILKAELKKLLKFITSKNIEPIIIIPSELDENINNGYFGCLFNKKSIEKSKELSKIYQQVATELNYKYIILDKITKPSILDGLHYDKNSHKLIAQSLKELLVS